MNLYLFDPAEERRDWKRMLPAEWLEVTWNRERQAFEVQGYPELVVVPGLLIAHERGMTQPAAQRSALENARVFCLIVSGGPGPIGKTDYLYRRKAIVTPGKDAVDQNFKKCFQRFWEDFNARGEPNWKLIEPDPYPEHLVAAYLLMVAKDQVTLTADSLQRITEGDGQAFWTCVRKDLSDLEQTVDGLPQGWNDLLGKDMSRPSAALQAIFQKVST